MRWIARFRFVTAAALGERFGVSDRAIRMRVARLEQHGLVKVHRQLCRPMAIYLSHGGTHLLGLPARNAPRVDAQWNHELAIVWQVAHFEKSANPRLEVLTERECRARERDGVGAFHVRVSGERSSGARGQRWPDIVCVIDGTHRIAVELELTAKHTPRLQRIVAGYIASDYYRVIYYVDTLPLARRLLALAEAARQHRTRARLDFLGPPTFPRFDVAAWSFGDPDHVAAIQAWLTSNAGQQAA